MAELAAQENGAEAARLPCRAVERMVCEIWSEHFGRVISPYGAVLAFGLAGDESLDEIHARIRQDGWYDDSVSPRDLPRLQLAWAGLASAARRYQIQDYDGPVILFQDAANSGDKEASGDWRASMV